MPMGLGVPTRPRGWTHRARGSNIPTPRHHRHRVTHAGSYLRTSVRFLSQLYFRQLRVSCNLDLYLGQILSRYEAKYLHQICSQTFCCKEEQYLAQIKFQIVKKIGCVDQKSKSIFPPFATQTVVVTSNFFHNFELYLGQILSAAKSLGRHLTLMFCFLPRRTIFDPNKGPNC